MTSTVNVVVAMDLKNMTLVSNGAWPHNDMIEFLLSSAHTARRALKSGN